MDTTGADSRDKALMLIKVYLLMTQTDLATFCDKQNTRINGLVFEIDRALTERKKE